MSSGFKLRTLEDLGKEQYSKTAKSENESLLFFFQMGRYSWWKRWASTKLGKVVLYEVAYYN